MIISILYGIIVGFFWKQAVSIFSTWLEDPLEFFYGLSGILFFMLLAICLYDVSSIDKLEKFAKGKLSFNVEITIRNLKYIVFATLFGFCAKQLSEYVRGKYTQISFGKVSPDNSGSKSKEKQSYYRQKREYKYTYTDNFNHQKTYQNAEPFKPAPRPKTQRELCIDVLGLSYHCNKNEIRTAYKRLAKKYHPDQFSAVELSEAERNKIETKMKDINAAYSYLMAA